MGYKASVDHGRLSPLTILFGFDLPSAANVLSSVPTLLTTTLRLLHFRRLYGATSTAVVFQQVGNHTGVGRMCASTPVLSRALTFCRIVMKHSLSHLHSMPVQPA